MDAQELRWLTYLLTDLGERPRSPPVLSADNKAMLAPCLEQRLEHIALRYFLARELQQRRQLRLSYVASWANTPDVFTKALGSVEDLITHLRTSDTRYRTALPAEFLDKNPPPMYITLCFIVTRLLDSLHTVRDHILALDPTDLTVDLLEKHLLAAETIIVVVGAARGTPRTPFFEGCSPSPLAPSYAFAAAVDILGTEDVRAASFPTGKRRSGKGKGGKSGGGGSGGGGGRGGRGGGGGGGGGGSGGGTGGFGGGGGGSGGGGCGGSGSGGGSSGGSWGGVSRYGSVQRGGSGGGQRQQQQRPSKTPVPQQLREWFAQHGASGGSVRPMPPDPGIEATTLGASEFALPGYAPAEAVHTFKLDSGASHCFFRDRSTLTPLLAPVPIRLADSSGGPVLARSSTVLPCPAVPSGSLSGLHLPSFSMNLHHRLGHPSLPHLRGMHSRLLVSGLPRSLPPLPPSPAPPFLPYVEGRQRAAPHSSFPLQTLHMDVWGPARVSGQDRERYFLLVVDDYTHYTTVFPLRSKGEVVDVLIPWIRAVRLQLRERFHEDLPVLHQHSDRGGEFSSDLLRDFCCGEGILQSFTLPASPQQNGVAERRIGLVMEVAHTSMIHAAAPHFMWPFATSPTLRWSGNVGNASVFWVWGSRACVRDTSADKLSSRAIPYIFHGFPPDARGWKFYHPTLRRVLPSQDVAFDESVPFYCLFPYRFAPLPPPLLFLAPGSPPVDPLPLQGPAPSGVSQVDPPPLAEPVEVTVESGAARGAASGGTEPAGAEPGGAEPASAKPGGAKSEGAKLGGAESEDAESGGAKSEGAESGGVEPRGTVSSGGPAGAGGSAAVGTGAGGARATSPGGARVTTGAGGAGGARAAGPGGARTGGSGATGSGGVGGTGAGDHGAGGTRAGDPGAGGTGAGGSGAGGAGAGDRGVGGARAGDPGAGGTCARDDGAGGTGARDPGAGGTCAGDDGAGGTGARDPGARGGRRLRVPTPLICPLGANIVDGMWIFRVKRPPGSPPAFKAHYVARGFSQRQGDNFLKTFSPTLKMTTLWVLLHVAAQRDYELHSLDFSTAFLQGSLHEEIWLCRPFGFTGSFLVGTQWSFRRPVYGLRHAPREWHDRMRMTLAALGHSLSAPPLEESVELSGLYPELVGCLMYLMTCTRPDLAYTLSILACYVAPVRHRPEHWEAAKRVLCYLCSTSGTGLVLGGRGPVVLTRHADASWVDDLATQWLSQGYTFSLGSGSVSWRSTRSSSVLSSSCEAEIYAGAWLHRNYAGSPTCRLTWESGLVLLHFWPTDSCARSCPKRPCTVRPCSHNLALPCSYSHCLPPRTSCPAAAHASRSATPRLTPCCSLHVAPCCPARRAQLQPACRALQQPARRALLPCALRSAAASASRPIAARASCPAAQRVAPCCSQRAAPYCNQRVAPYCGQRVALCCPTRHALLQPARHALLQPARCALLPSASRPTAASVSRPTAASALRSTAPCAMPCCSQRVALCRPTPPPSRPAATTATAAAGGGAAGSARSAVGDGGAGGSTGSAGGTVGARGATGSAGGAAGAGGAGPTTDRHCLSWPLSQQLQRLGVDSGGHCLSQTTPPLSSFASGQQETFSPQVLSELFRQRCVTGSAKAAALGASESAAALGASESATALGTSESAAALGASESGVAFGARASPATGPPSAQALHTFTLDSGASRCFFRDCTTLAPLAAPAPIALADPTGGKSHKPPLSSRDVWVDTVIPGGLHVAISMCSRTGCHLATFTRRPGSSLYTLTTASAQVAEAGQVAASSQVSASGQLAASCSYQVLSH
ncbi:unnamed protein product [Closterium sp. NIES-54]